MSIDIEGLDERRVYDAIRNGVQDAMWRLFTNATSAPCADFYEMVKQGVKEGIVQLDPDFPQERT